MSTIIDITNDPGFARLRVLSETHPKLVEFSKTAELAPEIFAALPSSAFAWEERRKFPIHTPEHAAISAVYSKYAAVLPTHVRESIKLACEAYSISSDVLSTVENIKTASEGHCYLMAESRFRVDSPESFKVAVDVALSRLHEFSDDQKTEICRNIVKTAEHFNVEISPEYRKYAGQTMTDTEVLADWLDAREVAAEKVGHKVAAVEYRNLAKAYRGSNKYLRNFEDQHKLASCIAELDRVSGVEVFCGKKLPNAILTVWNTTKLSAAQVELNGMMFDKNMLASLPVDFWNSALGPDFVAEFAPNGTVDPELLAQILPTLPADMKTTLVSQLSAYAS